ncbi:MAG: hypothetical protein GY731_01490 [Gammaproteobacteria bacterium]|nr:hypothetical protein [Gammaproteobacteria bacterium]
MREVTETLFLANVDISAGLWLKARDNAQVAHAFIEMRAPTTELTAGDGTEQLETDYERRILLAPGGEGNPYDDRFYVSHAPSEQYLGFGPTGKYEIYYYVEDVDTHNISAGRRSVLYKNLGSNDPPQYQSGDPNDEWNLLTPENGDPTKTGLILDWEDAEDPEGHALTYTLTIADDANFSTFNGNEEVYLQEELTASQALVDASAGLQDLATYYWKVEAIDEYGAKTCSAKTATDEEYSFDTDNQNSSTGLIQGLFYSDQNIASYGAASVSAQVGGEVFQGLVDADTGAYAITTSPGAAEIEATLAGYQQQGAITVEVPVSTGERPHETLNIAMSLADTDGDGILDEQDPDDDNDGIPDNEDNFPLDTDNDGADNVVDEDDDGDGLSDVDEATYGTDPLKADTDGDGMNDGDEINVGRNPLVNEASVIMILINSILLDD